MAKRGYERPCSIRASLSSALLLCSIQLCVPLATAFNVTICCHLIPQQDAICYQMCTEGNTAQVLASCSDVYLSFWNCILHGPEPSEVTPTVNSTVPTTSQLEPPTVHELVLNEGLKCCHNEPNEQCRLACIRLVDEHQHLVSDKILLGLSEACNQTQSPPEHPLWECLETTYLREINNAPYFPNLQLPTLDLARLTCCFKSTSIECREECINYHLHPTPSLREGFRTNCLHSAKEIILYSCFEDVTSPSKPGCSDMGFCRMFNSHPANMFRHCGSAGNQAAHREYMEWERNQIFQHSFINVTVPLKDVSVCMTDWWKTLACFLHIQPTDNVFHTSTLCRSDCLLLMESCADKPSLAQVNLTPEAVCNQLSPAHNDKYCVGLSPYVNAQQGQTSQGSLQYPCDDGRCQEGEVCIVNSDCVQDHQNNCQTHSCVRGCHIGLIEGVSSISVPLGQVQKLTVPLLPYNRTSTLCHSYHTCHQEHLHHSAQELTKQNFSCYQLSSCQVQGKELAHNHKLQEDCNMCVCRNGHLLCSNLTCTDRPTAIVIHPCRDTTVQRFDRLKCSLSSFTSHKLIIKGGVAAEGGATNGSCLDSRGSNKCPTGSSCIGSLGPCLVGVNGTCQQTSCVGDSMCSQFGGRDVCTTSNVTLTDVCSLVRNQSQFAYWGSCKSECSLPNPICGADGNTYHTPCHAHSLHIPIDYSGRCHDDGCGSVRCPPLQNDKCKPVTPPGACCPKCGGLLAVLFDKPQLLQDLPQMGMHTVRVGEVLSRLEEKINTLGCQVTGYISPNGDDMLFVVVLPQGNLVSHQQVEGCQAEALAMVSRINQESVYYAVDGLLTHLASAKLSNDVQYYLYYSDYLASGSRSAILLSWQPFYMAIFGLVAVLGSLI